VYAQATLLGICYPIHHSSLYMDSNILFFGGHTLEYHSTINDNYVHTKKINLLSVCSPYDHQVAHSLKAFSYGLSEYLLIFDFVKSHETWRETRDKTFWHAFIISCTTHLHHLNAMFKEPIKGMHLPNVWERGCIVVIMPSCVHQTKEELIRSGILLV